MYRDHGRKTKFEYDTVGYNARIDNLQAVIVQAKLKKVDDKLKESRGEHSERNIKDSKRNR